MDTQKKMILDYLKNNQEISREKVKSLLSDFYFSHELSRKVNVILKSMSKMGTIVEKKQGIFVLPSNPVTKQINFL